VSEQGTHFWFMSIRAPEGAMSFTGTVTPGPGETRLDLFGRIHDQIVSENPAVRDASVLAFDIQPNQI